MSELNTISRFNRPLTKVLLCQEFRACGLKEGMGILVHSSLSSMGSPAETAPPKPPERCARAFYCAGNRPDVR